MSTAENTATEKRDVYERVTSQIIKAIEQGVSNWRMPWQHHLDVRVLFGGEPTELLHGPSSTAFAGPQTG